MANQTTACSRKQKSSIHHEGQQQPTKKTGKRTTANTFQPAQTQKHKTTVEEVDDEDLYSEAPSGSPKKLNHILEAADGSDKEEQSEVINLDDNSDHETPEAKLGNPCCHLKHIATDKSVEQLKKTWTAPIYAFFKPTPQIKVIGGQVNHVFVCGAMHCKGKTCFVR